MDTHLGFWIYGDLHAHSHNCEDGTLPVLEIVRRSRPYCDFLGISGHAYDVPAWGERQHLEIAEARRLFPDMPIFHTAEQEFPIPRHTMFITSPGNHEQELQRELIRRFHRLSGHEGLDEAMAELRYVEETFGADRCFMIFNHPNSPDVALDHLLQLAESPIFKVMACVDRRERRASQTWDIGGEWDALLKAGYRIYARCGSDFHAHFTDGGEDYLPGEFVQDCLHVRENSYEEIIRAYRAGDFFCMVDRCIEPPVFSASPCAPGKLHVRLNLQANWPFERIDLISNGESVRCFQDIEGSFSFDGVVSGTGYIRVRGAGHRKARRYSPGEFQPMFLLNPVFF